jgi:hypothetical protein
VRSSDEAAWPRTLASRIAQSMRSNVFIQVVKDRQFCHGSFTVPESPMRSWGFRIRRTPFR